MSDKGSLAKKKNSKSKEIVKQKLRERKKQAKQALKLKKARLVIKNLPFKATKENLKEYFEQYGEVANVDLLKKENGKLKGCGFIQFKLVQKAAKARHHLNGKEFMGRKVTVDFAKAIDKYKKEIKKENIQENGEEKKVDIEILKEEPIDVDEFTEEKIDPIEGSDIQEKSENSSEDESEKDEDESEEDEEEDEIVNESEGNEQKVHFESNDVSEGKTIFVKNVPFQATNDDLKQCMLQFGRVYYALICVDKLTEHSKGTAFVKFLNKEDAEKALNAGTELTLLGNVLDCHPALGRNEVQQKIQNKKELKKEPKDSRNLYLVKEGVILAGTKAAESVSANDMAKRLQIEQYKTQMLRNLNMFVSKDRLVVHNIPSGWDDKKLRALFQKYGGPGTVIKEARVMRDMKNVDAKGIGTSKNYGFVAFTKHENALAALRNLNNNPKIFSPTKRPIVTFSIENKKMINAREKRLEKSKANNLGKDKVQKTEQKEKNTFTKISRKRKYNETREVTTTSENEINPFSGVAAKPGTKQKMRSRYKLSTQAKLHYENLKKEKKKQKNSKKTLKEKKKDFIKQPKQKINKNSGERDNFSKLVNEYKNKLVNAESFAKKTKWFE
ncbi:RNA-binding protein 28-like [Anoplophora glabripennis]|uniref:RNA-binding protein 28-like n=1 Tax=Anoplophora glabripennis TaxID=217634 RepID=UPI0008740A6C|nr:RNA-binding protein 28-like [Anoplophora glabripennis]